MPKHSDWGKKIRKCFVAEPGCVIASWDLNQIEMRVMAHLSGDANLKAAYIEGRDIHAQTAQKVFNVPPKMQDESLHRLPAKTTGFGTIMGITAKGLMEQLHTYGQLQWTEEKCQGLLDGWFTAYPGTWDYQQNCIVETRETLYAVEVFSGRRFFLPGIVSPVEKVRGNAERQSFALRIQSGAQTIMKVAMRYLTDEALPEAWERGYRIEPLIQIHDDLVFHMSEEAVEYWNPIITYAMTEYAKPRDFSIPIKVKGAIGSSWGELREI